MEDVPATTPRYSYEERVVVAPPSEDTLVSGTSVETGEQDAPRVEGEVTLEEMKDGLSPDGLPPRYRVLQRSVPGDGMSQEQMNRLVSRALETEEGRAMVAPLFFDGSNRAQTQQQTSPARGMNTSPSQRSNGEMQPSQATSSRQTMTRPNRVNYYGTNRAYPTSYQLDPDEALDNPDVLINPTYDGSVSPDASDSAGTFRSPVNRGARTYESGVNPYTRSNQNVRPGSGGAAFETNATLNSLGQGSVAVPQTPSSSSLPAQTTGQPTTQGTRVNANQTTGSVPVVPSRSALPSQTVGNGALGGPAVGPATGGAGTAGY